MSQTEPLQKYLSPTEIERLNQFIAGELAGKDLPLPQDDDIQQCLAVLQGSAKVRSHDTDRIQSESSATVRFSSPQFVGSGGFGVVFLVHDNVLGIEVAIKMLRPSRNSPVVQQRFLEEARITASLHHPGIIRLFDSGLIDDIPYITSAIADEGSLRELIDKNPNGLAEATACRIMADVADAVAYAHSKLTFHRDIKPGNILLTKGTESNQLKPIVSDFGLAKRWDKTEAGLTLEGDILGTTRYMSPEQARGDLDEYSVVSEVFTLGIILYELLSGKLPFEGSTNTEIRRSITSGRPIPLTKGVTGLSADVRAIVHKCLERNAEDRYESVIALAKDLRSLLAGQPVSASRPSIVRILKWKAKEHPWVAAGFGLTVITMSFAACGIAYAGWAQSQSLQREYQTKIAYVVLLGQFVDDVVSGEKNQQVAILESLGVFEKNLKDDLRTSPTNESLIHLLSLVHNYQAITHLRSGDALTSFNCRVKSVILLRELKQRDSNNAKYRFQYLNGLAQSAELVKLDALDSYAEALYQVIECTDRDSFAIQLLSEIDVFERDFDKPQYISAANDFRLLAARILHSNFPKVADEAIEKAITSSQWLMSKHPDDMTYISPALNAYTLIADRAHQSQEMEVALEAISNRTELIEQHMRKHQEKQSVLTCIVTHENSSCSLLFELGRYPEALAESKKCLNDLEGLPEIDGNSAFWRSTKFQSLFIQYSCLENLNTGDEIEIVRQRLFESAKRVGEQSFSRQLCQAFLKPYKVPLEIAELIDPK
ncbi:MAG: serine/threonine-protein kinase [Pirellulales bacterium]